VGFKRVILSVGYLSEVITSYFGNQFQGLELVYEIEESPLGTGGAIRMASRHCLNDHFFVFNGDTFLDLEVSQVENLWKKNALPIIVARNAMDVSRYGSLEINDGRLVRFLEKGKTGPGLINAGCYVLPNHELDDFPEGMPFSLENQFLTLQCVDRDIDVFVTGGHFIDIGVPEDYFRAQVELNRIINKH
jgi:D-glycero-alpha-D-manno-heptose 1-phosphate guanylyltransferase